jgi:hypothetical protein
MAKNPAPPPSRGILPENGSTIKWIKRIVNKYPDKKHESHKSVRSSDASTFDFICDDCGATDDVTGGWGTLRKPCKGE